MEIKWFLLDKFITLVGSDFKWTAGLSNTYFNKRGFIK